MKLGEFQSWLSSPVAVRLVGALISQIIALLAVFGVQIPFTDEQVSAAIGTVFQFAALALSVWALRARAVSPIAPLTMTKTAAEVKNAEQDPVKQAGEQGGFAHLRLVALLGACAVAVSLFSGCVGTGAAFKAAESPDETAFVVAELYAANVTEAAAIAAKPGVPLGAVRALQSADRVARPAVEALRPLSEAYLAVKSSDNAAALQEAVDKAVRAVADLVRAVKSARGGV